MILNVAAGGLVTTFRPILAALNHKFQIDAAVIDPYFGLAAANGKLLRSSLISYQQQRQTLDWFRCQHPLGGTT